MVGEAADAASHRIAHEHHALSGCCGELQRTGCSAPVLSASLTETGQPEALGIWYRGKADQAEPLRFRILRRWPHAACVELDQFVPVSLRTQIEVLSPGFCHDL